MELLHFVIVVLAIVSRDNMERGFGSQFTPSVPAKVGELAYKSYALQFDIVKRNLGHSDNLFENGLKNLSQGRDAVTGGVKDLASGKSVPAADNITRDVGKNAIENVLNKGNNKKSQASLKDMLAKITKKIADNKTSMDKMLNALAEIDALTSKPPGSTTNVTDMKPQEPDKSGNSTADNKSPTDSSKPLNTTSLEPKPANEISKVDSKSPPNSTDSKTPTTNGTNTGDKKSPTDQAAPNATSIGKVDNKVPPNLTHYEVPLTTPSGNVTTTPSPTIPSPEQKPSTNCTTPSPPKATGTSPGDQKTGDAAKKYTPKSPLEKAMDIAKAADAPNGKAITQAQSPQSAELAQKLVELILRTLDSLVSMETTVTDSLLTATNVIESELTVGLSLKRMLDLVQDMLTTVDSVGKELIDLVCDVTEFATEAVEMVSATTAGVASVVEKSVQQAQSKL